MTDIKRGGWAKVTTLRAAPLAVRPGDMAKMRPSVLLWHVAAGWSPACDADPTPPGRGPYAALEAVWRPEHWQTYWWGGRGPHRRRYERLWDAEVAWARMTGWAAPERPLRGAERHVVAIDQARGAEPAEQAVLGD